MGDRRVEPAGEPDTLRDGYGGRVNLPVVLFIVLHVLSWASVGFFAPFATVAYLVVSGFAFSRTGPPIITLSAAAAAPILGVSAVVLAADALRLDPESPVGLGVVALPAAVGMLWTVVRGVLALSPPRAYARVPAPPELGAVDLAHDAHVTWTGERPVLGLAFLIHAPAAARTLLEHLRAGGPPGWSRRAATFDAWLGRIDNAGWTLVPWSPFFYAALGARGALQRLGAEDSRARAERGDRAVPGVTEARQAQEGTAILFIRQVWTAIDQGRADQDPPNLYTLVPTLRLEDTPTNEDLTRAMGRPPVGGIPQAAVGPTPPELEAAARVHTARVIDQSLAPERLTQMALGLRPITPPPE